jgi:hypothetical protein
MSTTAIILIVAAVIVVLAAVAFVAQRQRALGPSGSPAPPRELCREPHFG